VKRLKLVPRLPVAPQLLDFEAVYDAEWGYVWVWLQRLGVQEDDLPDLTQEVFVRAYRAWGRCDFSRPLRPWLFGIAYRVMLGFRRLARHRLEVAGDDRAEDAAASGEEAVALGEHRRLFLAALDSMDVHRRAVFVLHEVDGYTAPEIAEALTEPLNTVYSRLRLARKEFEKTVKRRRREGDPRV
jgi:RNA polymerase sigma-70 factor (ECF subfamily)